MLAPFIDLSTKPDYKTLRQVAKYKPNIYPRDVIEWALFVPSVERETGPALLESNFSQQWMWNTIITWQFITITLAHTHIMYISSL